MEGFIFRVACLGERPFTHGEQVSVFARRATRWDPLRPSQTPHPAQITRINLDATLDVVYL